MKIAYERVGEYNLPMVGAPETNTEALGVYAQMRLNYLKNYRPALYTNLLTTNKLSQHLGEIETQAVQMEKLLASQMTKREGVDEALKAQDRMEWVGQMNNIQMRVKEAVMAELVYS